MRFAAERIGVGRHDLDRRRGRFDHFIKFGPATAGVRGATVVNTPTVTLANAVTHVGMRQTNLTAQLLGLGGDKTAQARHGSTSCAPPGETSRSSPASR